MAFSMKPKNDVTREYYTHEVNPPKYSKDDKVLIIDGDILAYKLAAMGDERACLVSRDGKTKEFKNKTEFKKVCLVNDWDYSTFEKKDILKPKDIKNVIGNLKAALNNILREANCNKYELYLGGSDNFRVDLPLPEQYKSSRKDNLRPTYLPDSKDYLLRYRGAKKIKGRETDDYVQQRMFELHKEGIYAILYSNDKDARQPLHHDIIIYNPDDKSIKTYKGGLGELWLQPNGDIKGSGLKWLIGQTLFGDSTDTYKGNQLSGITYGDKSYYNDVSDLQTIEEVLNYAVSKWREWYPEPLTYEAWNGKTYTKNWLEIAEMYWECAYMKISDNDPTTFESLLKEYLIEY